MSAVDLKSLFGLDAVSTVAERMKSDPAFRAEAETDLNAAIKRHYGIDLPMPLRVAEENGQLVAVPAEVDGAELSDEELDLVAGGIIMPPSIDKKESSGHFGR